MKGALIGFGFIASKGHFPAYLERDDVDIVAVCDSSAQRLALIQKSHPDIRVYQNHKALLSHEQLDFIDICTPPFLHHEVAHSAAQRGIHVLCEKPLTATLSEAEKMLGYAKENKVVIFPCHNYKHAPIVKAMQRVMAQNEIGHMRFMTINTFRSTHAKGVAEADSDWRRKPESAGGGIVMDHGSHTFYLTFMFMKSMPTSVTAKVMRTHPEFQTEDNCICTLNFPSGYATVHLSWTAGCRKIIYMLHGTTGACKIEEDDLEIVDLQGKVMRREKITSDFNDTSHVSWFSSLFDQFKTAINNKDYVNSELIDAYTCMSVIESVYASSKNNSQETPVAVYGENE